MRVCCRAAFDQAGLQQVALPAPGPRLGSRIDLFARRLRSLSLPLRSGLDLDEGLVKPLELRDVLALPGLVAVLGEETFLDADETKELAGVAEEAVASFVRMRREEGEHL